MRLLAGIVRLRPFCLLLLWLRGANQGAMSSWHWAGVVADALTLHHELAPMNVRRRGRRVARSVMAPKLAEIETTGRCLNWGRHRHGYTVFDCLRANLPRQNRRRVAKPRAS
jgi:hypothetical protein